MPRPSAYDAPFRAAVLEHRRGGLSYGEIAALVGCSRQTAFRIVDADRYGVDEPPIAEPLFPDKAMGKVSWRKWAEWGIAGQELRKESSWTNHTAAIHVATDEPILVVPLSDFHWGSWGTDYRQIIAFTDELLATPNVYIALLGDLEQQAIKMRGVLEVSDNQMPPEIQSEFSLSWLEEMAPKILFATWDNHSVQRQEDAIGQSVLASMLKKRFVYFNGIGHVDLSVGTQTYRLAVSHKFKGGSVNDPVLAQKNYMLREGQDREIAIQGDTHRPGRASYYTGPQRRLALNCGTLQTNSGYAQRFFSLFSQPTFPCFELYPDVHMFNDYESLGHWKRANREAVAA